MVRGRDRGRGSQTGAEAAPQGHTPAVRLSLVIPCHDRADDLPALVGASAALVARADAEVLLVESRSQGGSSERLAELVRPHPRVRALRLQERAGTSGGILAGLRAARGDVLAWSHAVGHEDIDDVLRGLALLEGPEDAFVKGQRTGRPLEDAVFSWALSAFSSGLFGARLWDVHGGPTLLPRWFHDRWNDPPSDDSLDLYAFVEARRQGLPVKRFPVHHVDVLPEHDPGFARRKWRAARQVTASALALRSRLSGGGRDLSSSTGRDTV